MFRIAFQYVNPKTSRAKLLRQHLKKGFEISEPVSELKIESDERILSLLCLNRREQISHICWARKGNSAGTRLTKLNFDLPKQITTIIVSSLLSKTDWIKFSDFFVGDGAFKNSSDSIEFIALLRSQFKEIDDFISESLSDYVLVDDLSDGARAIVRQEHDAVEMALRAAEMIPRQSYNWSPTRNGSKEITSFFSGLKPKKLEDDIIRWDLDKIPGFITVDKEVFGYYVMENGSSRIHLFHANKNVLENTLGVDLIYFNEAHQSYVLVQYKMLEPQGTSYIFRFPDKQLETEIRRMTAVKKAIDKETAALPANMAAENYRLIVSPFFLKFCPRDDQYPDTNDQVRGMIIPLDMWNSISSDTTGRFSGPLGGQLLSFKNCPRHFDNTKFISMLQEGWIGTSSAAALFLKSIIEELMTLGHSVILAAKIEPSTASGPISLPKTKRGGRKTKRASKRH